MRASRTALKEGKHCYKPRKNLKFYIIEVCTAGIRFHLGYMLMLFIPLLVTYLQDGCKDLVAWMNKSSLSTLKRLHIVLGIKPSFNDPLCGLCEELTQFAGLNVIEEINLNVFTWTDKQCTTDRTKWGRLDTVLANGFPMLRRVSLHIDIKISACRYASQGDLAFRKKLHKIPEYFPWLSRSTIIAFKFSAEIVDSDDDCAVMYTY